MPRGSAAVVAVARAVSWSSYARWAARCPSSASTACARARPASSQRSSARRRASPHGPLGVSDAGVLVGAGLVVFAAAAPRPDLVLVRGPADATGTGTACSSPPGSMGDRDETAAATGTATAATLGVWASLGSDPSGSPVDRMAASALAAALARRAVSIGSTPLETGTPWAAAGWFGATGPDPLTSAVGSTNRNAGSVTVPGRGARTGVPVGGPLRPSPSGIAARSAGPYRAGSTAAGESVKASLDSVLARRRGTASGATVTRTSRAGVDLERRVAIRAAPAAIPRISPIARKAISLPVTRSPTPSDRAPHQARRSPLPSA